MEEIFERKEKQRRNTLKEGLLFLMVLFVIGVSMNTPIDASIGDEKEKDISQTKIRFSEVFPDPVLVTDSEGEFFEIENYGEQEVDLSEWRIVIEDLETKEKKRKKVFQEK